jgi:hypothetical protein
MARMAEIEVTEDRLVVHVTGIDKVLAFRSRLEVPLAHVAGVDLGERDARSWWHGIRAPGTSIPGLITAGTFIQHGELVFWDVHRPEQAVAVDLRHESCAKLVVGVDDPVATVEAIRAAVADLQG